MRQLEESYDKMTAGQVACPVHVSPRALIIEPKFDNENDVKPSSFILRRAAPFDDLEISEAKKLRTEHHGLDCGDGNVQQSRCSQNSE